MDPETPVIPVPPARFERTTPGLGILCSIHLSYGGEGAEPGDLAKSDPAVHTYATASASRILAWTIRDHDVGSPGPQPHTRRTRRDRPHLPLLAPHHDRRTCALRLAR